MIRYRIARNSRDRSSAALGIPVAAYVMGIGLLASWFVFQLQPRSASNPGVSVYKPPPATVISYAMPGRLLTPHGQAPPVPEIESRPPKLAMTPRATAARPASVHSAPTERSATVPPAPERSAARRPGAAAQNVSEARPRKPLKRATASRERYNPLRHYASTHRENSGGFRGTGGAYPGYSGDRPF